MNKITNCPNCGAVITHSYNHKCEYCGTFLHIDDKVEKLENTEVSIEKVEIERAYLHNTIMITLLGWTIPKWSYLTEAIQDVAILSDNVGKPVAYRIEIPIEEFYKDYNSNCYEFLWKYIINRLPPKLEKQEEQIIKMLIESVDNFMSRRGEIK